MTGKAPKRPPSNFSFLRVGWPDLCSAASEAERVVASDPRAACFHARRALELTVQWLYDADRSLRRPYKDDLSAMLFEPTFQAVVEPKVFAKMDLVRKQGNAAVHRRARVDATAAAGVLRELFHILYWVARTYARTQEQRPPTGLAFDRKAIPRSPTVEKREQTREALWKQVEKQERHDLELAEQRKRSETLEAELERLRKEVDAVKAANAARPDDHDYNEEETRDRYIDVLLTEAGWPLDQERDREYEVSGMPNEKGKGFVDYVLWGDDGKPLAVVEAKRTRRDPKVGRRQAELYADCLEEESGQRPLIFYTNGYEHWIWDDQRYPPRSIQGFLTKDELALAIQRRTSRKKIAELQIDSGIAGRHYQQRAIRKITEAFEHDNQRDALVVMATGAGKTRTVIALIDLLMRAGWVKRALFLADRTALVNQATNAFKNQLRNVATVNLVTERKAEGRVYVSTYPTMMGLIGDSVAGEEKRFGPGVFDLVIIDEAHRSVYAKYRAIFDYFDALLVGLTATPKDEVDRNTYGLFNLEPGVPTDAYGLDDAVAEGYLVPPKAVTVPLKFPRTGVSFDELSEEEQEQWEELDWGEEDIPDGVDAEAVNRWLFNKDTVDKVLETLMLRGHRVAGGDRLGKTIIFAKNNDHAEFIVERFDASYPKEAGHFARVVTFKTEYAQSLIDDFSIKDKAPHIAASVDMLDTGIDVPEIVNLVFFKRVRSKTKFWQMLGRGTRLCTDLYGPGDDKTDFYVFDCCANVEYFNQDLDPPEGRLGPSIGQRLFSERIELILALDDASGEGNGTVSDRGLRIDTAALLRDQVAAMNLDNFLVRPQRRTVERFREEAAWESLSRDEAAALAEKVADLPTEAKEDDEAAKRFDLIILGLQLRRLRPEPGEERLRRQVQEIAAGLLEQTAIPAIREQAELLEELAGDEWWVDVTLPMLERVRRKIRGIVRLLEKRKRAVVYTEFLDELGRVEEIELKGVTTGADFERFKEKARAYLREHENLVALNKLRKNKPLTSTDLGELERVLLEAGVATAADLEGVRQKSLGLGRFIRSLVGLERDAASDALSTFIGPRNLNAAQLHFVDLVVDHLTQNGLMDPARLYETPFTEVSPSGPEGLFDSSVDIDELIDTLNQVNANAEVGITAA